MALPALLAVGIAFGLGGCVSPSPKSVKPAPIQSTARPLPITVAVRGGSFDRSHLNPQGIEFHFAEQLRDAGIFEAVLYPVPVGSEPPWELELAASDYGVEGGYALELQALLLQRRVLIATYHAREQLAQHSGARRPLEVGPESLGELARQATRALLSEIARDVERLRSEVAH